MNVEGRLTVGKLKEMLKDVPDDLDVVVVDEQWAIIDESMIQMVTQVGYLKSDYEEHDAIGFAVDDNRDMRDQIGLVDHMLFKL